LSKIELARFGLDAIFSEVKTGDFHASSHLDIGHTPLISCKTEKTSDHGVEGCFDIPVDKTYEKCVTITCDGDQPSTAFYHPYRFAAKDNVLVGIPKKNIKLTTIFYFVAYLNCQRWRFSYGRKCYENKKDKLTVLFPIKESGEIDEDYIEKMLGHIDMQRFLPSKNSPTAISDTKLQLKPISINELFHLHRGDFHNASSLPKGNLPLVSCGENDNGVIRYCKVPQNKTYSNTLTIAYNGRPLTTKFHPYRFAAKDDVAVCLPKKLLKLSSLIFIQYMINRETWRYSYGRKCFNEKLKRLNVSVPVDSVGNIDEAQIERIVLNTSYWSYLLKQQQSESRKTKIAS